ncbi:MAG: hypothetical protein IT384_15935, partial [Deltaproteobacteria bacterium]|nr:hypothetical protein [Deltaproteobacteria bacterium]
RTDASVSQDLGVTAEHPFWTSEGWRHAAELEPGDLVLSASSGWLRVAGATWVQERTTVHNLEVSGPHTYAAGPLAAWVHNGCERILQTGGNKIVDRTARGLNEAFDKDLPSPEWGRVLERLKSELSLPNEYHGKIAANGDYLDEAGNVLGNLGEYLQ